MAWPLVFIGHNWTTGCSPQPYALPVVWLSEFLEQLLLCVLTNSSFVSCQKLSFWVQLLLDSLDEWYHHVTVSGVHASMISIASVPSQLLLSWFESSFWLYSCFQLWAPVWGFTDCSISIILGVICWLLQHLIMPDVEMWGLSSFFFFLNQFVFWFNKPVVQTSHSTGATGATTL